MHALGIKNGKVANAFPTNQTSTQRNTYLAEALVGLTHTAQSWQINLEAY